jgi:hypothetical protein
MTNPVVMLDIDGCLVDFVKGYTSLGNDYFDSPIFSVLDQQSWIGPGAPKPWDLNLTATQHDFLWAKIKSSEIFWTQLNPLLQPSTYRAIDDLQRDHDLYFVTNRPGVDVKAQTEAWLSTHGIHEPSVILAHRKGDVATGIGANFALDDKAGNAVFMKYASPSTRVYLLDRPYNLYNPQVIGSKVIRLPSVEEFINVVRHLDRL